MIRRFIPILAALLFPALALGQPGSFKIPGIPTPGGTRASKFADVADWTAEFIPATAKPGQLLKLKVTISPKPNCWTYPFFPPEQQTSKNWLKPVGSNPVIIVGSVTDPTGWIEKESAEPPLLDRVYKSPVTWEFDAIVSPNAKPQSGPVEVAGFHLQTCNKDDCFSIKEVSAKLEIEAGPALPIAPEYQSIVSAHLSGKSIAPPPAQATRTTVPIKEPIAKIEPLVVKKAALPLSEYQAQLDKIVEEVGQQKVERKGGLLTLLLTAAFWGFVSLVTPCVFPMIPITVSLFLKQGNQTTASAIRLAGIYCGTIIAVLGLSAIFLLSLFRELSIDPIMNIFLGGLFIVFALSLFGMYDITLPNFLLRYSEGKRRQGGSLGVVFGAIAFSIVSFTCVAPFLGGFAGMTASGQYNQLELILAGLTFASAFAAPFFVLAIFPSLMKKLPKSGGWLDSVKAVMGFLELAAALKFLRTAELRLSDTPQFFTYDIVLTGWVVIAIACGLYLLNMFRLPHDEEQSNIGVPRLMFALMFLGLGIYLLPGIFKTGGSGESQRPNGVVFAWVDAFLLPEANILGSGNSEELPWTADLPGAIAKAKADAERTTNSQFILTDFTGVTCTNCKVNEHSVFPLPAVKEQLRKYNLVQMYTDDVPTNFYITPPDSSARTAEATQANLPFQKKMFGTQQLPLYVVWEVKPDGKISIREVYGEGTINNVNAFVEFLVKNRK